MTKGYREYRVKCRGFVDAMSGRSQRKSSSVCSFSGTDMTEQQSSHAWHAVILFQYCIPEGNLRWKIFNVACRVPYVPT